MNSIMRRRVLLAGCTALVSTLAVTAAGIFTPAMAAEAPAAAPSSNQVQEVVVTAQRREQNVQDVPVAVTALTRTTIATNRVVTVNDLNLLAPGFTVVPAAGGTQIPSFSMRGVTSYGVVPGSDKAISVYLDGVYLSANRGSIFALRDVSQIEVLRGPQGTLFGRNATAGAISITTRDPTGKFGVEQDFTVGNEAQFRSRTTVDLPAWGPFSAYASYVRNYSEGDIQNTGAGTHVDLSNGNDPQAPKSGTSPKWLGGTDSNSFFAAVKFAPTDNFSAVYKYDYTKDTGTPNGVAYLGYDATNAGTLGTASNVIASVINNQATPVLQAGSRRPDKVDNAYTLPMINEVQGHSLTMVYEGANFTIKDIASYRQSYLFSTDQLDGVGGLIFPQQAVLPFATLAAVGQGLPPAAGAAFVPFIQPYVGQPFALFALSSQAKNRQWSDELQYIYRAKQFTLTVGGLLFQGKDASGGVPGLANNVQFASVPNNKFGTGYSDLSNLQDSIAAYAQAEVHVTSNLDIVGGIRETKDWKSGLTDIRPLPAGLPPRFTYVNTQPSYLAGVNYRPTSDTFVYLKYSTAFVSGGKVAGIPFAPETVASWEGGFKGEFFDHRLRTNVALWDATYQHYQDAAGGGANFGPLLAQYPWLGSVGTFIVDQGGPIKAHGVEFEGTYVVGHGLTVGSNVSYQHTQFDGENPGLYSGGQPTIPTLSPTWTVGLWGNYVTTFSNGWKGQLNVNANWRSALPLENPAINIAAYAPYYTIAPTWLVNGRYVVSGLTVGGVKTEVAIWGKNLTDDRSINYALLSPSFVGAANYQPARTFGLDVNFKY
jgi:iron complex outermembrane receptor protein